MRRLLLLLVAACLLATPALANGLQGLVRDRESGQPLIGADVVVVGTTYGAGSDLKGRFEILEVPAGEYEVRVTYLGYNTHFLTGVRVTASQPTEILVDLESFKAYQTDDMVISGARVLSTDSALLINRQQASVIGDAISAAQISRSPDGNSGDALRRVPGLTVNDGKYVYVRGIGDRYNVTEVNGVQMGGTNVDRDRKSFNFDMVPANLLASITVIKQATPDLPGDFSGGLVKITTLEFPEEATTSASFSVGYIGDSTGETMQYDATEGGQDWLGIDDGGRDFPAALRDSAVVYSNLFMHNPDLAKALPNRWTTVGRPAPPKLSFSLSHGNNVRLFGTDVGYMGAVTYGDKASLDDENELRLISDEAGQPFEDTRASGTTHHTQTSLGGLANLFLRRGRNQIGFTNLYNRVTDSEITFMSGYNQKLFEWTTMSWHERYQFVDKLDGSHHLPGPGGGFELDWQVSYGESHAFEPDRRYLEYVIDGGLEPVPPQMDENMRTWTWLDETRRGRGVDLAWSPAADNLDKQHSLQVKAGYRRDERARVLDAEAWYTAPTQSPRFDWTLAQLPADSIFAAWNYNDISDIRRGTKWEFAQDTHLAGVYTGRHDLDAWYAMLDLPFTLMQEELRLTGGARVEDSRQAVYSTQNKLLPSRQDTSRVDQRDVLPSASLTWLYDADTNVRLGYYVSVNRPEFREMSPVLRRDYRTFQNMQGNPDLKRARVLNYDLRLEHFPGPGQVIAVSGFYKRLHDAIEDVLLAQAAERPTASFTNTPRASNWGFELEAALKLDRLPVTQDLTIAANYSRIWSEVLFDNPDTEDVVEEFKRTLQGQAPWSVNLSLLYDNPRTHTTFGVMANRVGRHMDKLADYVYRYVHLEPRTKLDVVATQRLPWSLKLKAAVTDLLAQNTVKTSYTAPLEGVNHDPTGVGQIYNYSDLQESTTYSLSVSGKF